jgi:hypothetical protein
LRCAAAVAIRARPLQSAAPVQDVELSCPSVQRCKGLEQEQRRITSQGSDVSHILLMTRSWPISVDTVLQHRQRRSVQPAASLPRPYARAVVRNGRARVAHDAPGRVALSACRPRVLNSCREAREMATRYPQCTDNPLTRDGTLLQTSTRGVSAIEATVPQGNRRNLHERTPSLSRGPAKGRSAPPLHRRLPQVCGPLCPLHGPSLCPSPPPPPPRPRPRPAPLPSPLLQGLWRRNRAVALTRLFRQPSPRCLLRQHALKRLFVCIITH